MGDMISSEQDYCRRQQYNISFMFDRDLSLQLDDDYVVERAYSIARAATLFYVGSTQSPSHRWNVLRHCDQWEAMTVIAIRNGGASGGQLESKVLAATKSHIRDKMNNKVLDARGCSRSPIAFIWIYIVYKR